MERSGIRVLLVQPPNIGRSPNDIRARQSSPDVGLAYVAAYLRENRVDVSVLDARVERSSLDEVREVIESTKPSVVGLTAMTHQIHEAALVAQIAKTVEPKTTTVIGGYHATALPEMTLDEFPAFDYAVFGEGEITMLELVKALEAGETSDVRSLNGVAYRDGNETARNGARQLIEGIDALPLPAYDLFPLDKYWPFYSARYKKDLPLLTSRGCPFNCTFCMKVMGSRQRLRSVENIIDEIGYDIERYGVQQIFLADESFTNRKSHVMQMCEQIVKRGFHKKVNFVCSSRVTVDLELLKAMRKTNFTHITFGIESGSQRILDLARKAIRLEDAVNAVRWAKQAGMIVDASFILGLPYETKETIKQTIRFACKLPLDYVTFSLLTPFPGTEVAEMARRGEGGLKLLSENWKLYAKQIGGVLELESVPYRELARLQLMGYMRFHMNPRRFWLALKKMSAGRIMTYFVQRVKGLLKLNKTGWEEGLQATSASRKK